MLTPEAIVHTIDYSKDGYGALAITRVINTQMHLMNK